ncbi:MAG: ABC transporter permease [Gemmatimonadetes bacterium]|nr:ABC transporter permease [Gemmatimonadota bacterium]
MDLFRDTFREAAVLIASGDLYTWRTALLSLRISAAAAILGFIVGVPVGTAVALWGPRARTWGAAFVNTGLAFPPVVVGLFVYMLLSRRGPLGELELLFTPAAMILAQFILAGPYVAAITLAGVQQVPADLRLQAMGLGASRWRALWLQVREARGAILAGVAAGFGAAISEVGAVMIVGGNILEETRVLTTAIVLETRRGQFARAMAMGLILLAIAFAVNVAIAHWQQRQPRRIWT